MNKILLDTDIYSEVLKGVDANVASRARSYRRAQGVLTISVVTANEIVRGFQRKLLFPRFNPFGSR